MTLAKRVIPCLDVREGKVVKSVQFVDTKDVGDAIDMARRYDAGGADELVFLDINASHERRRTMVEFASRVAEQLFIPFTVGGGIASADLAGEILREGADKVAVNSGAVRDPRLIAEIADRYGSQATVLSLDARRSGAGWEVVLDGGRVPTGKDAIAWVKQGVALGAGEVLVNSIDRDGTKQGFDLALTAAVADAVNVPVIASGGASSAADFATLFAKTGAEAGLAASIFHYGELTIADVKRALLDAGVPVRPPERALA
ncbi:MAG: imidazole glycerol phosphate synthase subunit HisF [Chloroflexi bacterium]|nr:imidazole glycerol phosphate synthase subunit HisF [Chloroflexota bacterium]